MPRGDRLHGSDQMIHLGLAAVEFDDQQRFGVKRIAGVDESLRRFDGEAVHHLHFAGLPAPITAATQSPAPLLLAKPPPMPRSGRRGTTRTVTSVTTPSIPSEPTMTPSRS